MRSPSSGGSSTTSPRRRDRAGSSRREIPAPNPPTRHGVLALPAWHPSRRRGARLPVAGPEESMLVPVRLRLALCAAVTALPLVAGLHVPLSASPGDVWTEVVVTP